MSNTVTAETQVLLQDNFGEPQVNPNTWDYNHFSLLNNTSFYGRTQQMQSLPTASNGFAHLVLQTYNPTALTPGDSFVGSEIRSKQTFSTAGGGIAFEVRARFVNPVPGIVGGIFGYNFNTSTGLHDEIDVELLSNDAVAGRKQVQTNIYAKEPLGAGHPVFEPASDLTSFHTYRIEWFSDRVRWLVDNLLVREDTTHVPQGSLALDINEWAPASDWAEAFSAGLKPATTASNNTSYTFDVTYARVTRLSAAEGVASIYNVTNYAGGTDIRDSLSGAVLQSLPAIVNDSLQFLSVEGREYARNLASAQSLGLNPAQLRDYDGNDLGMASAWKMNGLANVRASAAPSYILVNPVNGRWAEAAVRDDGTIDITNHGKNGDTRVVGIYEDPLIKLGLVTKGSPFDSQTRFQGDIFADRLVVLGGADYDHDGFVDLFFKLTNHAADHHDDVYLRAIMHLDGNIQYANYMNGSQFQDWMTRAGTPTAVYSDWLVKI